MSSNLRTYVGVGFGLVSLLAVAGCSDSAPTSPTSGQSTDLEATFVNLNPVDDMTVEGLLGLRNVGNVFPITRDRLISASLWLDDVRITQMRFSLRIDAEQSYNVNFSFPHPLSDRSQREYEMWVHYPGDLKDSNDVAYANLPR
jgi:hypothetical protein